MYFMFYNFPLEEEAAMTNLLFILYIMKITSNTLTNHAARKILGFEIYSKQYYCTVSDGGFIEFSLRFLNYY